MKYISAILGCLSIIYGWADSLTLLNVSYDPTRELYRELNRVYQQRYEKQGHNLHVEQSHGGSAKQARSIIEGLEADVATLALGYDIDILASRGLVNPQWQKQFPHNSTPFYSTIVFLVRKGNPHQIHDWNDLTRTGIKIITPNPKTSGGARWNYLAAYGYALRESKNEMVANEFVKKIYKNVKVLDTGARGSTTTFVKRGIGDVLITWENDALFITQEKEKNRFQIIYPSISIMAQPPVAIVEKYAKKHKTYWLAQDYLSFLYTDEAQKIAMKYHFRPTCNGMNQTPQYAFFPIQLFTLESLFGTWQEAQKKHFSDGGIFDTIFIK